VRTKNKATKQMQGERLGTKYQLARGGGIWWWTELVGKWYSAVTAETRHNRKIAKQFRDRAWSDLAYLIRTSYEKRDGSAFRAIADAFDQGSAPVDLVRSYVFFRLKIAMDCDGGRMPTQAKLRRDLIAMGQIDDDALRMSVARACRDSELVIPKGRPGPKGNNS